MTTTRVRRRFLQFLVSVAVVHVIAIAAYHVFDVERAPASHQRAFAWTWMGVTVLVVLIGLQRIKRARRPARGGTNQ